MDYMFTSNDVVTALVLGLIVGVVFTLIVVDCIKTWKRAKQIDESNCDACVVSDEPKHVWNYGHCQTCDLPYTQCSVYVAADRRRTRDDLHEFGIVESDFEQARRLR